MTYNKFITFEGLDFSGKSTQIKFLKDKLVNIYDLHPIYIREPGGTPVAENIRRILLDVDNKNMSPKTELLLYTAARSDVINKVIQPAIDNDEYIISDRYSDSTIAYQGFGRDLDYFTVSNINNFATNSITPNKTIIIDIDIEEYIRRKTESLNIDRMEQQKIDFIRRVRDGYLRLAELYPNRFIVVDGNATIMDISNTIFDIIEKEWLL